MKNIILSMAAIAFSLSVTAQQRIDYQTPEQKLNDEYCSGMFKATDGKILEVASQASVKAYTNILDWLEGRVAGLQVYQSRTGTSIPVMRGQVPAVFVDEQQVPLSYLTSLSVMDIAMVKVIKTPFLGGFSGAGGAIAIYTIMEDEEEAEDSR